MNALNLGCGFDIKSGWVNSDSVPGDGVDRVWDARYPYIWSDYNYNFVLINHVLCTMKPADAVQVLSNVYSILAEGGKVQVIDMDLLKVFKSYQEGRIEDIPIEEGDIDDRLCMAVCGYGTRLSLYTPARMRTTLEEAGFCLIEQLEESEYDTRPKESLIFEATKCD